MKRKLIAVLAIATMFLAGCDGGNSEKDTDTYRATCYSAGTLIYESIVRDVVHWQDSTSWRFVEVETGLEIRIEADCLFVPVE